ncbi:exopolysaccharide biosynthesis protein [Paenibacillus sp. FSL R7-0273]|uniref:phosphodiester glycosidase family protein n=1 Tax=Paenibacillus sp. FSL R7-0273 TaxID=1536772 RepID=UPI0004F87130|nr:phosphodiester glycosidase family protein [Paenibacillus sp. FSL R7-0273]AIQ46114.1 exopolysaccharide biosynthesis protein [Paenibacillus sp. FSL R7-0273]OMF92761.1 exopolysaccharide biosynthesis protein [Paenibacillus sp. FSL R7-0273]
MMTPVKRVNRFFMLLTAPFIGLVIVLLGYQPKLTLDLNISQFAAEAGPVEQTALLKKELLQAQSSASYTIDAIGATAHLYNQTTNAMNALVNTAAAQVSRPETIYNRRITAKLGIPADVITSDRITIELYRLNPGNYKAYALKIRLKDAGAMKMSLAGDGTGQAETTMQAVNRHGAVAGINAGGFADQNGKRYPLSTTIVDGKYLYGFEPTYKDLSFVGLSTSGRLIGGKFSSKSQLDQLEPAFGATFVPVLIQNSMLQPIPFKWQTSPARAPRTIIGKYKDDQILVLVADGYNESGNSGATLMELQNKLWGMGVVDAYNLDGGGSASLIFKGKVINKPSDGNLRQVPTNFLFFK